MKRQLTSGQKIKGGAMFKYLWIIPLVILWICWFVNTIKDAIRVIKYFIERPYRGGYTFLDLISDSTFAFLFIHIGAILMFSFYMFITEF